MGPCARVPHDPPPSVGNFSETSPFFGEKEGKKCESFRADRHTASHAGLPSFSGHPLFSEGPKLPTKVGYIWYQDIKLIYSLWSFDWAYIWSPVTLIWTFSNPLKRGGFSPKLCPSHRGGIMAFFADGERCQERFLARSWFGGMFDTL